MEINFNLNLVQKLIADEFKEYGLSLDKNVIEGDFVEFNVDINLKKFNNASVLIAGSIGNHGYGYFEAVFDEIAVNDESLIAVNTFNDKNHLCTCRISRRGNPGKYYPVFSRAAQFVPSESTMITLASKLLSDLISESNEPLIREILNYLK